MTTTSTYQGMNLEKPTSRVINPPGGRSNIAFGWDDSSENQQPSNNKPTANMEQPEVAPVQSEGSAVQEKNPDSSDLADESAASGDVEPVNSVSQEPEPTKQVSEIPEQIKQVLENGQPDNHVSEFQEPASEVQEPASEVQEPASEVQEPASEVQEPASEVQEPASEVQEPASEVQDSENVDQCESPKENVNEAPASSVKEVSNKPIKKDPKSPTLKSPKSPTQKNQPPKSPRAKTPTSKSPQTLSAKSPRERVTTPKTPREKISTPRSPREKKPSTPRSTSASSQTPRSPRKDDSSNKKTGNQELFVPYVEMLAPGSGKKRFPKRNPNSHDNLFGEEHKCQEKIPIIQKGKASGNRRNVSGLFVDGESVNDDSTAVRRTHQTNGGADAGTFANVFGREDGPSEGVPRVAHGSRKGCGVLPTSDSAGINPITGLPYGQSQADSVQNDTPQRRRAQKQNPENLPPAGGARITQPPGGKSNVLF
ncbi:uncharacterized protein LOC100375270 [Saccoglossus kowalevskii]